MLKGGSPHTWIPHLMTLHWVNDKLSFNAWSERLWMIFREVGTWQVRILKPKIKAAQRVVQVGRTQPWSSTKCGCSKSGSRFETPDQKQHTETQFSISPLTRSNKGRAHQVTRRYQFDDMNKRRKRMVKGGSPHTPIQFNSNVRCLIVPLAIENKRNDRKNKMKLEHADD
jgi:hypothetical protein